ncbi:hypothetical protein ACFXG1_14210 [Streptomyces sp. NPDC059248]|uniref:hypothetical protein n=1 Tax=Streptomyces sp. NPDC059248 TaxID=3346791 RepID=UPI0036BC166F
MRGTGGLRTDEGGAGGWGGSGGEAPIPPAGRARPRTRTWAVPALALIALVAAGTSVADELTRRDRAADNRAQLDRACRGLLPAERLRPYLPDTSRGRLTEYGTLVGTDPARGTRALYECRLSWGGGGPRGAYGAQAVVRAVALGRPGDDGGPTLPRPEGQAFPLALPPSALGESSLSRGLAAADLVVTCPAGVVRHGGERTTDLRIRVDLPRDRSTPDPDPDPGADAARDLADRRAAARTAVAVADWVTARAGCGAAPVAPVAAGEPTAGTALCRWLGRGVPGLGGGRPADPVAPYTTRVGACGAGRPGGDRIEAVSGSGAWGTNVYEDSGTASPVRRDDGSWEWTGGSPWAVARASSRCGGARVYHRVAVVPPYVAPGEDGRSRLARADVDRLEETARRVLARYLAAPDAWPARSGCRDTTTLPGESG